MSIIPKPWPFLDPEQYDWARGTVAAWRRWQAGTDRYQQDWFYMEATVAMEDEEKEKPGDQPGLNTAREKPKFSDEPSLQP